jgi:hypothetical protein
MKSLFIEATEGNFATPKVHFDLDSREFVIEGESFVENTDAFYAPIIGWLEQFAETAEGKVIFKFIFYYYNSSSAKSILRILKILKKYKITYPETQVYWYYPEGNEDLMQEGEDFKDLLGIDIHLVVTNQTF